MEVIWPAFLLAWVAGFVDALGYLALSHVFTAHMSGNAAAVGAHLGRADWQEAMARGLAIPAFVLGVAIGVLSEALASNRGIRAQLAPAFALEALLLLCFFVCDPQGAAGHPQAGTFRFFLLVWLLAVAMGIQNATLRRAGGLKVRTTYISGMLTNMAENATLGFMQWWTQRRPKGTESNEQKESFGSRAAVFGFIFLIFLAGGICGGYGQDRWGARALLAPIAGLVILIARDCFAGRQRKIPAG